jgi:hypothetical protein
MSGRTHSRIRYLIDQLAAVLVVQLGSREALDHKLLYWLGIGHNTRG